MTEIGSSEKQEIQPPWNIEVKYEGQITGEDAKRLDLFSGGYIEAFKAAPPLSQEWGDLFEEAYVHREAYQTVKEALDNKLPTQLITVRDRNSQILGYSVISFGKDPNTQKEILTRTFIGVRKDVRRKGIGKAILKRRIDELRGRGMTEYTTCARPAAIKLYDSLGINYESKPQPHHPAARILTVRL